MDSPANLFVAGFIGTPRMNIYDAELIKEGEKYFVSVKEYKKELSKEKEERLLAGGIESQEIILGVRPNYLTLDENGFEGMVDVTEMMGPEIHLHVAIDGEETIAIVQKVGKMAEFAHGDMLKFGFDGSSAHIFSKETEKNLEY